MMNTKIFKKYELPIRTDQLIKHIHMRKWIISKSIGVVKSTDVKDQLPACV